MAETQKKSIKKQQKFAINLGKGGGGGGAAIGIGVGIILVGGALTTAALVANAFQKKKPNPTNKNNNKIKTSPPAQDNLFEEKNDAGDKTNDFKSNLPGPNSLSYIHQHLISDGNYGMDKANESGGNREISAQNLLPDLNHKFEGSHEKEDFKCDGDEEIYSCSKDYDNGFIVETQDFSSDLLLHQSTGENNSCIAMELVEGIDGVEKTNTEEIQQPTQSKIESHELEVDHDQALEAAATETGETNCIILLTEDESKCGQDDDLLILESIEDLKIDHEDVTKNNKVSDGDEDNIREINDGQIDVLLSTAAVEVWEAAESVEESKGEKQPETPCAEEKIVQPDAEIYAAGEAVEEREGRDEIQIDGTGLEIDSDNEQTSKLIECQTNVDQDSNHVLLINVDVGVLDAVELFEKPKTENQTNEAVDVIEEKMAQDCTLTNATVEEVEEKETQHDVQTDTAGQVILDADALLEAATTKIQPATLNESDEVSEEEKDRHGDQINAAEDSIHAQIIGTEEEEQDEVQIDTTKIDQTSKLNECQATVDQDSNYVLLTTADAEVLDAVELLKAPKTENQTNEAVDMIEENKAQDCTVSHATEEEVEDEETQHDVQTDAAGKVILDQGCVHEVFDELLEQPKTDNQVSEAAEVIAEEEAEDKETQHDVQADAAGQLILNNEVFHADELLEAPKTLIQPDIHTVEGKETQYDDQINAAGQESEEKKDQHDAKMNAAEEVHEAQHEVQISAAGEAAEINSGSEQKSELIELQTFLDQDYCSHQMTSANTLPQENEQNMSQLNPLTGLNSEFKDDANHLHSSKINTEFISSEPSAKEDNGDDPLMQSAVEAQLIHQTSGAADTIIEDHQVKFITKEKAEVRSQAVDLIQEVLMDQKERMLENGETVTHQKTEKKLYCKEIDDDAISSKSVKIVNDEKESSNINLLKKYMLKLADQNDEQKGILMRNRTPIAIGTMSAILCPLFHWYFGLPLVKICLIAVLVIVLSKIQGF